MREQLEQFLNRAIKIENEIINSRIASLKISEHYWLAQYYKRKYDLKVNEWERLTGRKYGN